MTFQKPVPARRETLAAKVPAAGLWPLLSWCATVWVLVLMPVLMMLQVDALRVYLDSGMIVRDAALMVLAAVLTCLALATGAQIAGLTVRRWRGTAAGDTTAWAIAAVPTLALTLWQMARAAATFIKPATEFHTSIGPEMRLATAVLIAGSMGLAWWRQGSAHCIQALLPPVMPLRGLAGLLVGLAAALVLGNSHPAWHRLAEPVVAPRAAGHLPTARPPDIILITLDSLAAQDADVCNPASANMPRLAAFAAQGTCFNRHYAASNFTTPTTSTLETGTLPWHHLANQIGAQVAAPLQDKTLAMALRQAGYATHSVTANLLSSPRHHGTYRAYSSEQITRSTSLVVQFETLLSAVADSSLPRLLGALFPPELDFLFLKEASPVDPAWTYEQVPGLLASSPADVPVFVWVHTLPPHAPYLPPPSTKHKRLPTRELETYRQFRAGNMPYEAVEQPLIDKHRLRYQETILGADEALGRFLDSLKQAGRLDRAVVVVSADHGESFEKMFLGHAGPLLHDTLIRVPLVIKLPGDHTRRVVDAAVSQVDLAPTLLELTGARAPDTMDGRSLAAYLRGQNLPTQLVMSMSMEHQSRFRPLVSGHVAVMEGDLKLVVKLETGEAALFNLATDPGEQTDIAANSLDTANRLKQHVLQGQRSAEARRRRWFGP